MTQGSIDPKLSEWFQNLRPVDTAPEWSAEEIWAASRNELDQERTRELIDMASRDVDVADAWRVARELAVNDVEQLPAERRRSWIAFAGFAAAAALMAFTVWFGRGQELPLGIPSDRGTGGLESVLPAEGALPRDTFTLDWTDAPKGSRYFLEVADLDLNVIFSIRQLKSSEYRVPSEALDGVKAGETVLWRVEAFLDDGQHLRSATYRVRISE